NFTGHVGKVSSVALTLDGSRVASSDNESVHIWDVKKRRLIIAFNEHGSAAVTCIEWISGGMAEKVVCADDGGVIACTSLLTGTVKKFCPQTVPVTTMACSTLSYKYIAVGYSNGSVCIIDHTDDSYLNRYSLHNSDVV